MNENKFDIDIIATKRKSTKPKSINPFYDDVVIHHNNILGPRIKNVVKLSPKTFIVSNQSNDYVWCKNLLCNASPIEINSNVSLKELDKMVCKICGYKGFMPSCHILKFDEVVKQINDSRNKMLLSEFFRKINFYKLPKNISQQR